MSEKDTRYQTFQGVPYSWLVRPCLNYWEEHTHCKTFRSRFNQYYIDGELSDCSLWKKKAKLCDRWDEKDDKEALVSLIELEKVHYAQRLAPHLANDVWDRRTEPPKDWIKPLPDYHEKRIEGSMLKKLVDEKVEPYSSCVIL